MTSNKMIKNICFSIRDRLISIITVFVLLALGVSTFFEAKYFISHYKERVFDNIFTHESRLKEILEGIVYPGLNLGELEGVDSKCAELIKSIPFGVYCFVTDTNGRVYYSSDKKIKGRVYNDRITQHTFKAKKRLIQRRKIKPGNYVYDFSMPVYSYKHKIEGVIHVGVLSDVIAQEKHWIISRFLFISLFFVIFVAAGVSIFNKIIIINPINRIIKGLERFSRGELGYRIKYKRHDEFGQLTSSFNEMARQIALYQKEIISSKQYTDSIIESMSDSLIVMSREKIVEKVNNATLKLLGYERKELINSPITKVIQDDLFTPQMLKMLLKEHYIKGINTEYVRKDGKTIPFSLSVSFIWAGSGGRDDDNFKIIVIARDMRKMLNLISRLENTNAKLQESSLVLEKRVRERTKELKDYQDGLLNILEDLKDAKKSIETDRRSLMDIVEKSAEGIVVVDKNGKILFVNSSLCTIFRASREELKGSLLGVPLAGEDAAEVDILPLGGEVLRKAEMRVVETDWLGESAYLLLLHDITERIKFTETLKQAAQEWRSTFDAIADMVVLLDKEGRIVRSNAAAEKILGLSFAEMKGKVFHNIFNPDVEFDHSIFMRAKEARKRQAGVFRKEDKRFSFTVDPVIDEHGGFAGATCIVADITEEEKVKEELRSTKSFVESIVEEARSIIHVLDKDGVVISVNRFAEELLGYHREDIIGKNWFDNFVSEEDKEEMKKKYSECIEGEKVQSCEYSVVSRDNKEFIISWYASPLSDSEGRTIGAVALGYDVTNRKEIEEAQRLAQLGKLVADMAHEVNNPLMVISGRAQLSLMEDIQNEEIKNNFNIIIKECQRAKGIIQRLLKFSRPSKGDITDIDINANLDEVISLLEHQFSLSNVQILKDYGQNIPVVKADSKQLQEVFMNVFNNARDAMPQGGVIEVKTYYAGEYVNVEFKDSGSGMDKKTLSKVFDPFFTTKEKGTGLGLAVCYSIIKKQGGDMKFESTVGKGTTAIIKLSPKGEKDV